MKDPSTKINVGGKPPLRSVARRNPREDAELAEAEVARLQTVLEVYLRIHEKANDWLADQLRLGRKRKNGKAPR